MPSRGTPANRRGRPQSVGPNLTSTEGVIINELSKPIRNREEPHSSLAQEKGFARKKISTCVYMSITPLLSSHWYMTTSETGCT
ncbi:hypothetical protein BVRB_5g122880 [Beta vulgaris subsp. vulgaris]|uniref:Uncharacterized protein n=1 Tax=Beta vulgaris subsp. vulgaris TaxID=3555 RepID=A0A0J8BA94_BETVV|nr:hypothetical protein BVRB_5g122880 [Beta vulgaris subsp. vulgaris]